MKAQTLTIFGYASLINEESLRATVPSARNIRPAYIEGFRREFDKLDPEGFTETNLQLTGIPYCALNVTPRDDGDRVNGVVFEVDPEYMEALRRRESGYDLVETPAHAFHDREPLGTCCAFSARQRDGRYRFGEVAQERYLEICLQGARTHGERFFSEFLATTYIDGTSLDAVPRLVELIGSTIGP